LELKKIKTQSLIKTSWVYAWAGMNSGMCMRVQLHVRK